MNQVLLVGRLVNEPEVIEIDGEMKIAEITLAVQRNYKNSDGTYVVDNIPCTLWKAIALNITNYCHKDDVIGVKGRLQKIGEEEMIVVAEKVTFLASKGKETNDEK